MPASLLVGLQSALRTVRKKNTNTRVERLRVGFNGGEKIVNIQVVPIRPPGAKERTFLILFDDVTEKSRPRLRARVHDTQDWRNIPAGSALPS